MKYRFTEPIEKKRSSCYGNNYFIFKSRKLMREVTVFSNLEYDNIICLEMDYHVEWYCERPVKESFYIDGHKKIAEPDIYVKYKNGEEEFQIVTYDLTDAGDEIHLWAAQCNEKINIRTPKDIYIGPFFTRNISYLAMNSRHYQDSSSYADANILRYISSAGVVSVGQLINTGILTQTTGITYLSDLYYRGLIDFVDIAETSFSYRTEVKIVG